MKILDIIALANRDCLLEIGDKVIVRYYGHSWDGVTVTIIDKYGNENCCLFTINYKDSLIMPASSVPICKMKEAAFYKRNLERIG